MNHTKNGKKTFTVIGFLLGLVILVTGIILMSRSNGKGLEWKSNWSGTISVKDGVPDRKASYGNFTVETEGKYMLVLQWNPSGLNSEDVTEAKIGFVSGCTIMDEKGQAVYATSALAGDVCPELDLKAGLYHLDYWYLTSEKEFQDFAKAWLCGERMITSASDQYHFPDLAKDGTWNIDYFLHVKRMADFSAVTVWAAFGIVIGACLMVLALIVAVKRRGTMRQRYDERQEMEQGRGFRYAFFSMLIALGVCLLLDMAEYVPEKRVSILYAGSLFLGLIVYVVYCIWHDCYIALNEKRGAVIAVLGTIGVCNLIIAISGIVSNKGLYEPDGRYSTCVLNLMCSVTLLVIVVAGILRSLMLRMRGSLEEEDES